MTKKIISGCVAVLAVVFTAKIILSLVSETTIALLTGTLTGIMIAVPCAVICIYLITRQGYQAAPPPAQYQPPQFPAPGSDEWRAIYWELRYRDLEQQQESQKQLSRNAPVEATWRVR